jgi:type II secretory pathway pseudopilin PulG
MKTGFTMVELIVAISLLMIFSMVGVVYINNFNTRQKLDKTQGDIESTIKMAHNFAKVRQSPAGSTTEVLYVKLSLSGLTFTATVNGIGATYFSKIISESDVTVSMNSGQPIFFWGGSGKLVSDVTDTDNPVFVNPSDTKSILVTLSQGVGVSRTITLDYLGGIK